MNSKFDTFVGCQVAAFQEIASSMLAIPVKESTIDNVNGQKTKISIVVGLVGNYKGRILITVDNVTSQKMGEVINCGELADDHEMFLCLSEFTNIFVGRGLTKINNEFKDANLRLTPPAIFEGDNLDILTPAIHSKQLFFDSELGQIFIDIGFEGV